MDCFGYCLSKESYNEMNTVGSINVEKNVDVSETVVNKEETNKVDKVEETNKVDNEVILETNKVDNEEETTKVDKVEETNKVDKVEETNKVDKVEETNKVDNEDNEVDKDLDLVIIDNRVMLTHPIIYNDSYMNHS
jgi:hypothetical protein